MDDEYGDSYTDTSEVGCLMFVFIVLFIILGYVIGNTTKNPNIISKELLTPEIQLTVKDNVIDTLYIYEPLK